MIGKFQLQIDETTVSLPTYYTHQVYTSNSGLWYNKLDETFNDWYSLAIL